MIDSTAFIIDFLKLDEEDVEEIALVQVLIESAKDYVKTYTGRTYEEIDNSKSMLFCLAVIVEGMYHNRSMIVEEDTLNPIAKSILDLNADKLIG
ncbi:MAG: head-tail connector protein [Clostridium baratii]|nr:head-tail connector protein [Clostridium baratii]